MYILKCQKVRKDSERQTDRKEPPDGDKTKEELLAAKIGTI